MQKAEGPENLTNETAPAVPPAIQQHGQSAQNNTPANLNKTKKGNKMNLSGRGGQGNSKNPQGPKGAGTNRFQRLNTSGSQSDRKWEDSQNGSPFKMSEEKQMTEKLMSMAGSTADLPVRSFAEAKFSGRSRLYVGNLGSEITEQDLKDCFSSYGEIAEVFLNKEKGFAFVRLDYKFSSERAKRELDGKVLKGRTLRVRTAPHSAAVKVKNLSQFVTNELLEKAFSIFGDIERAVVIANERGQSTNEGIVEFVRKPGALAAIRRCSEGCFFLTSSLRPVVVEPMEQLDDEDGFSERAFVKKTSDYLKEREAGPRFAEPNSFQHSYGQRWKQLLELYKQKMEAVERELRMEEEKLISQMEYARFEHETEMLREQLRQREQDRERQKRDWEMKERQREESRLREEETLRRQREELEGRLRQQEEEMRRRQQENSIFMQEQNAEPGHMDFRRSLPPMPVFDRPMGPGVINHGPMDSQPENKPFHNGAFDQRPMEPPPMFGAMPMGGRMDIHGNMPPRGPPHGGPGPRWGRPNERDRDDFISKRRRF